MQDGGSHASCKMEALTTKQARTPQYEASHDNWSPLALLLLTTKQFFTTKEALRHQKEASHDEWRPCPCSFAKNLLPSARHLEERELIVGLGHPWGGEWGVKQRILSYHMTPVTQVIGHRQQHCPAALQHCLFSKVFKAKSRQVTSLCPPHGPRLGQPRLLGPVLRAVLI